MRVFFANSFFLRFTKNQRKNEQTFTGISCVGTFCSLCLNKMWTLWDALGMLGDTQGRSRTLWEALGTFWDARERFGTLWNALERSGDA